jgi:hypothetical protein
MHAHLARTPAQDTDVIARAAAVPALAALAVIHVVDLPGTLGPSPLIGIGYLVIIAVAIAAAAAMIVRSHWAVWAAGGGLAAAAMGGYLLTRALSGGFLGDHADVGNWRCPLGIAALSVETLIIILAAAWVARLAPSHRVAFWKKTAGRRPRLELVALSGASPIHDSKTGSLHAAPVPSSPPASSGRADDDR